MPLLIKNDEQIKVGTTPGLITGSSSFTFDGTGGKPDYRQYEIVISELTGRGILVRGLDYSWNTSTGFFQFLQSGDIFAVNTWYNVHFQPLDQPFVADRYSIINASFFVRSINIPNIANTPGNKILETLNSFIRQYEPVCLDMVLGYELHEKFLAENTQRMTDLLYGAVYQIDGRNKKWQGLVYNTDVSLIANYIYYEWQEAMAKQTTGTGTKVAKQEGGDNVSPRQKMQDAWYFFSKEVKQLCFYLWNSKNIDGTKRFPEFSYLQVCETLRVTRPISFP